MKSWRRARQLSEKVTLLICTARADRNFRQHIALETSTDRIWKQRIVTRHPWEDTPIETHQEQVLEGPGAGLGHREELDSTARTTNRLVTDPCEAARHQALPLITFEVGNHRELTRECVQS